MALHRAKLGVSLFRHTCRKPLSRGKGLSVGLPPSPRLGLRPKPHFNNYGSLSTVCGAQGNYTLCAAIYQHIERSTVMTAFSLPSFSAICSFTIVASSLSLYLKPNGVTRSNMTFILDTPSVIRKS